MDRIPTCYLDKNGNRIFMHHRLKGEINGHKGIFIIKNDEFKSLLMEGFDYNGRYKQHGFLKFNADNLELL